MSSPTPAASQKKPMRIARTAAKVTEKVRGGIKSRICREYTIGTLTDMSTSQRPGPVSSLQMDRAPCACGVIRHTSGASMSSCAASVRSVVTWHPSTESNFECQRGTRNNGEIAIRASAAASLRHNFCVGRPRHQRLLRVTPPSSASRTGSPLCAFSPSSSADLRL